MRIAQVFMVKSSRIRTFRYTLIIAASLFSSIISIASLPASSSAQEEETVDIESLKSQLESSRASLNDPEPADKEQSQKSPNDNLEKEEQALMQKLKDVVPAQSKSAETEEQDKNAETSPEKNAASAKPVKYEKKNQDDASSLSSELAMELKVEEKVPEPESAQEKPAKKKSSAANKETARISNLDKINSELRKRNAYLQSQLDQKLKELEETRNRLVIAETQVESLSGIVEKINNQKLAQYLTSGSDKSKAAAPAEVPQLIKSPAVSQVSNTRLKSDSLIGVVTAQKAYLRSGPSKDDSPIMSVSRGTRLVVETRNNEWYRVITPTGGRAWIATDMLSFGAGTDAASGSALRVGGYEQAAR